MGESTVPCTRTRVHGIDTADIGRRHNLNPTYGLGVRALFKRGGFITHGHFHPTKIVLGTMSRCRDPEGGRSVIG